jgi:glyoxylase I family protein
MNNNIHSLQHVSLIVANTQKSLHFYCELLQLQQDFSRPDLGYEGAWLSISAEQQIHLLELPNPDPIQDRPEHGGRDRHAAFMVNDLQLIVDQLNHAKIGYTLSKSGRRALFCRDLDNNALEFIQVKDV